MENMYNNNTAASPSANLDLCTLCAAYYEKLSVEFSVCHQDPINVILHLLTTPIGIVGALSLLRSYTKGSSTAMTIMSIYVLSLLPIVPNGVFVGTVILCAIIVQLSRTCTLTLMSAGALIVLGYVLQDLAHMGTGEVTFQSTYSDGGHIDFGSPFNWLENFAMHCYYLVPLCVHTALPLLNVSDDMNDILKAPMPREAQQLYVFAWLLGPLIVFALGSFCLDSKNTFCFFPGMPYFHRVVQTNLKDERPINGVAQRSKKVDMKIIRDWIMAQNPPMETSSHWWHHELPVDAKEAMVNCSDSSQIKAAFRELFSESNYYIDPVWGMNEIYVTGPKRVEDDSNSDHVFYSRHVDGPFGLIPFASVYRCIVGMDTNHLTTTHFPLANVDVNACEGDVLAFDFNREVHYISQDESKRSISDKYRVVIKLHYAIYPRVLAPLGWLVSFLNTQYNMSFRALFLKTINPQNAYEHFLAWNVNWQTAMLDRIETLFGQRNVLYLLFILGVWHATGVYEVFFALTSFVHYFRYISTFYIRRGIDFGSFRRDVLLFKSLAFFQIFYHYLCPAKEAFVFDPVSLFMIVSGSALAAMATSAIGVDRTYFAAELGLVPPKWVSTFPYGYIPHPMIVSQVWALLGLYKAQHFRTEWPYVVPIHIALYLVHMLQEHFNIYKVYPDQEAAIKLQESSRQKVKAA
jgi:hypothetical protein